LRRYASVKTPHNANHIEVPFSNRHEVVRTTRPEAVSKVVSRISVWSRYLRVIFRGRSFGAMRHRPFSFVSQQHSKHAAEEKPSQQSESIEPLRPTDVAVSQSPINA
jgi:hypothetical protein